MTQQITIAYISEATYFDDYEGHYEWVDGQVIEMSPITSRNYKIQKYLSQVLDAYFIYNPIGEIREDPFVMRLAALKRNRQPDIMVVLGNNRENLTETHLDGAADICVEVVSEGSIETDRGTKFAEYQQAGVREYWLIDPISEETLFYRLTGGVYKAQLLADSIYQTPLLPKLKITVSTLLSDKFPDMRTILDTVKAMLETA